MAESFGVEDRGHFYDPVGALRDVVVNHLMQVWRPPRWRRPPAATPRRSRTRRSRSFRAIADADPAHYVRGQYDGYRDDRRGRAGLDDRDLRRAAARHRELALVGRAVLHPHGQAPAGHPDRAAAGLQARRRASASRRSADAGREPDQLVIKLDPSTGVRYPARRAPRRRGAGPSRSRSTWSSPRRAARRRRPTRCCCTRRWSATAARFTRQDGVEETWRIMQPLLDAPPARAPLRARSWGPEAADALVAGHGGWRGPWIASCPSCSSPTRTPSARSSPSTCRTGCEAIGISTGGKTVDLRDIASGEVTTEAYDKLVLSPGAQSIRPPLPGIDLPGIFEGEDRPRREGRFASGSSRARPSSPGMHQICRFQTVRPKTRAVVDRGRVHRPRDRRNLDARGFDVTLVELEVSPGAARSGGWRASLRRGREAWRRVELNDGVAGFEKEAKDGAGRPPLVRQVYPADIVILASECDPTPLWRNGWAEIGDAGESGSTGTCGRATRTSSPSATPLK